MQQKFLMFWLPYKDFHFYKDVGQVPYRFKVIFGLDAEIVCFKNESEYCESSKYLRIINITRSKIRFINTIKIWLKLIIRFRYTKIFYVYQIGWPNYYLSFIYKMINNNGFVYLKMDNCSFSTNGGKYYWENLLGGNLRGIKKFKGLLMKKFLHKYIDLYSVEDKYSKDYYLNKYNHIFQGKICTSLNGHVVDLYFNDKLKNYLEKENIILTVGRLGTYQKATEILLDAFRMVFEEYPDWQLYLVGSIDKKYNQQLNYFFNQNKEINKNIKIFGYLSKKDLFDIYNRGKIFCLPSRFETWANVYSEAMYFKNAIITTTSTSPWKYIDRKMGIVIQKDNVTELYKAMKLLIKNEHIIDSFGKKSHQFARKELNWDNIVKKLYEEMLKRGLKN